VNKADDAPSPTVSQVADEASASTVVGDRSISPIADRFGSARFGQAIGVAALAVGCGLFLLATARHTPAPKQAAPLGPAKQIVAFEPAGPAPTLEHPGPDAPSLGPGSSVDPTTAASDAGGSGASGAQKRAATGGVASPGTVPPIFAYNRAGSTSPGRLQADVSQDLLLGDGRMAARGAAAPSASASDLDHLRRADRIALARAERLPDRSFLILAGTTIPCVLQTAMDTSTPGYVSCVIPSDIWSENGAVVLLEKGSKVLGEYRGGLHQGQARIFVAWTRAVTPDGVSISLASPASDALGRAGFDGEVDTHFWQRFGGAVLLSVIDGGLSAASRSGDVVNLQAPSQAADTALKSSIDIQPTLKKPPGAQVAIFAAQDFDFSGVYGMAGR
jgi:type IV secretion system protein VirB10